MQIVNGQLGCASGRGGSSVGNEVGYRRSKLAAAVAGGMLLLAGLRTIAPASATDQSNYERARKAIEKVYEDKKAYDRLYSAHPEAGMEQELKRILEVERMTNPKIQPTQPSRYKPQAMPGDVILWGVTAQVSGPSRRFNSLAWIDKDRVLLVGSEGPNPSKNAMYIWDTAKGTVTPYSDHKYFCYADGYLVSFPHPQRGPIRWGAVGKQKEVEFDNAFKATADRARQYGVTKNPNLDMQCREGLRVRRTAPLGPASEIVIDLGKRDGMIVTPIAQDWARQHRETRGPVGPEYSEQFRVPLQLVNDRFPKGRPLPIWAIEEIFRVSYSDYRKRYVVVTSRPKHGIPMGNGGDWPAEMTRPVHLIGADGNAETIEIPGSAGWKSFWEANLAIPGVVFLGTGTRANRSGGIFLYDGRAVAALDIGFPESQAVSADGCKLAYAINNDDNRPRGSGDSRPIAKFKYINFCQE